MLSFIFNKVTSSYVSIKLGKKFILVKNIYNIAKYIKIIKYRFNAVISNLKIDYCTKIYSKRRWQLILDICYNY